MKRAFRRSRVSTAHLEACAVGECKGGDGGPGHAAGRLRAPLLGGPADQHRARRQQPHRTHPKRRSARRQHLSQQRSAQARVFVSRGCVFAAAFVPFMCGLLSMGKDSTQPPTAATYEAGRAHKDDKGSILHLLGRCNAQGGTCV